jgi:hypothetical protein
MTFNSFEFANEISGALMGQIGSLTATNEALTLWTNSTTDLTTAWQQGNPNSTISKKIAGLTSNDAIQDFIKSHMLDSNDLTQFSLQNISALLTKLSLYPNKDSGGTQLASIQSYQQLISAQQSITTSIGNTDSKAEASYAEQIPNQQAIGDAGSAAAGLLSAMANLLTQSFL